jgi:hypothetical protein
MYPSFKAEFLSLAPSPDAPSLAFSRTPSTKGARPEHLSEKTPPGPTRGLLTRFGASIFAGWRDVSLFISYAQISTVDHHEGYSIWLGTLLGEVERS